MMTNKLCHLPQDHSENLRGRAEDEGQSPELVGLHQRHHKMEKMLVHQIDWHMEIHVFSSIDTNQLPGDITLMMACEETG